MQTVFSAIETDPRSYTLVGVKGVWVDAFGAVRAGMHRGGGVLCLSVDCMRAWHAQHVLCSHASVPQLSFFQHFHTVPLPLAKPVKQLHVYEVYWRDNVTFVTVRLCNACFSRCVACVISASARASDSVSAASENSVARDAEVSARDAL